MGAETNPDLPWLTDEELRELGDDPLLRSVAIDRAWEELSDAARRAVSSAVRAGLRARDLVGDDGRIAEGALRVVHVRQAPTALIVVADSPSQENILVLHGTGDAGPGRQQPTTGFLVDLVDHGVHRFRQVGVDDAVRMAVRWAARPVADGADPQRFVQLLSAGTPGHPERQGWRVAAPEGIAAPVDTSGQASEDTVDADGLRTLLADAVASLAHA